MGSVEDSMEVLGKAEPLQVPRDLNTAVQFLQIRVFSDPIEDQTSVDVAIGEDEDNE